MKRYIVFLLLFLCPSLVFATTDQIRSVVMMAKAASSFSVTDNFNRADENPISGSGVWVSPGGSYGNLKVLSNQVTATAAGNSLAIYSTSAHTFSADQYSQVKVVTTDSVFSGPIVRWHPTLPYFYRVSVDYGDVTVRRVRSDGNGTSWVAASGQAINGKVLKLSATGTSPVTIKVYIDGVQAGSDIVDSTAYALTSGQPGLGTTSGGTVDDWQGGEL